MNISGSKKDYRNKLRLYRDRNKFKGKRDINETAQPLTTVQKLAHEILNCY